MRKSINYHACGEIRESNWRKLELTTYRFVDVSSQISICKDGP